MTLRFNSLAAFVPLPLASTAAVVDGDPKGYIEGNKMAFPGLKKEDQIADVIAYIKEATGGS